jgi:hypothetical protein
MNEAIDFLTPNLSQADVEAFAASRVNLPKAKRDDYLEKLEVLRRHLARHVEGHEELGLVKSLISGSVAKGTALRTVHDLDLAVYLKGSVAPHELNELLPWLRDQLRETFHQIPKDKIYVDEPCVVIEYSSVDVQIEVMPVLQTDGDRGFIFDHTTRAKVETNIAQQLEFIRTRKANNGHFAQVIRLLKWWSREKGLNDYNLRSFTLELLAAHVLAKGGDFMDYHEALIGVFSWIKNSQLLERVAFNDYYKANQLPARGSGVEIFDPVNSQNNLGTVLNQHRQHIVDAASEAFDALAYSKSAQTKGDAVDCWRKVMGQGFSA